MADQKVKNNLTKTIKINDSDEVSSDFFDYYEDDEPYQEIQIT
jgi:hypothetical protein